MHPLTQFAQSFRSVAENIGNYTYKGRNIGKLCDEARLHIIQNGWPLTAKLYGNTFKVEEK